MFRKNKEQLDETAIAWVKSLPDYFNNVIAKLKDRSERSLKIAEVMKKAKESSSNPKERQQTLELINKLRDQLPTISENITEGETNMADKKTNLDMFLEGIESVEVSKKPKFHNIHRLYEAKDSDEEEKNEKKDKECEDEKEVDEMIAHDPAGGVMDENKGKDEADAEEGEDHEAGESDDEEAAEQEAGDDDEQGGEEDNGEEEEKDEESEEGAEEDDGEEDMEEGVGADIIDLLKSDVVADAGEIVDRLGSFVARIIQGAKDKAEASAKVKAELAKLKSEADARKAKRGGDATKAAAAKNVAGAATRLKAAPGGIAEGAKEDEMDEGAQGYAAGLKGVRKDAGAKHLKSGSNKVPAPKMNITGDKKLLKKPTTLKGDTYPKSSVAGAARPGAPKVKKS